MALLSSYYRKVPVGLWGHVLNYVNGPSKLDQCLKQYQARRADHIFAYTPRGAREAEHWGIPPEKITCVMNTVDTGPMRSALNNLSSDDVADYRFNHHATPGKTAAFIGGIDDSKRIDFLVKSLDIIWRTDPSFRVLLGGRGHSHYLFESAIARGQVVDLGRVDARGKALMATIASTICMPGRIGLVAIDALALGLPVVTTDWPFHSPEVEYLHEGTSLFSSQQDPDDYAQLLMTQTARNADYRATFEYPTIDNMVHNFQRGIHALVQKD